MWGQKRLIQIFVIDLLVKFPFLDDFLELRYFGVGGEFEFDPPISAGNPKISVITINSGQSFVSLHSVYR